jgi:hypothetical protein
VFRRVVAIRIADDVLINGKVDNVLAVTRKADNSLH